MARDRDDRFDHEVAPNKSGGAGIIWLVLAGVALMLILACGGGAYFVFRGVKKFGEGVSKVVTEASERVVATNNMNQIGIAVIAYEQEKRRFPSPYLKTKDGKPGLSWRVAILPYLGPDAKQLYGQFKLDEPWDSAANKPLLNRMPPVFAGASDGNLTSTRLRVLVGKRTMFDPARNGVQRREIVDGVSQTILLVEAEQPVPWTKPEELEYDANKPLPAFRRTPSGTLVLSADGAVHALMPSTPETAIRNLITIDDGVLVTPDW